MSLMSCAAEAMATGVSTATGGRSFTGPPSSLAEKIAVELRNQGSEKRKQPTGEHGSTQPTTTGGQTYHSAAVSH